MSKRSRFNLPLRGSLTPSQNRVIDLPLAGCHLTIGGPGTGKSIVAHYRMKRCRRDDIECLMLVHNKPLLQYSKQLDPESSPMIFQWMSWFWKQYYEFTGSRIPKVESAPGEYQPYDWDAIQSAINNLDEDKLSGDRPHVIIDEGQDMPLQFYLALCCLGYENIFVLADQNQQINHEHSSRRDLMEQLSIQSEKVLELTDNFRNSPLIARLAATIRPDDPSSPLLQIAVDTIDLGNPALLYDYDPASLEKMARRILLRLSNDPELFIGVIAHSDLVRERYLDALGKMNRDRFHGALNIQTYFNKAPHELDFTVGSVVVVNAQACKGLEFDIVFVADIHKIPRAYSSEREIQSRKLLYVVVARAREAIFLLKERDQQTFIEAFLPEDSTVLERKVARRRSEAPGEEGL